MGEVAPEDQDVDAAHDDPHLVAGESNPISDFMRSRQGKSMINTVIKGIFGTLKRR